MHIASITNTRASAISRLDMDLTFDINEDILKAFIKVTTVVGTPYVVFVVSSTPLDYR